VEKNWGRWQQVTVAFMPVIIFPTKSVIRAAVKTPIPELEVSY
jgi:hypothetical protein